MEGTSAPTEIGPLKLRASLKTEMMLSLAVLGTAALSLAALNAVVLETLTLSKDGPIYLALLILADILIFVAFGAYKIQGLVLDPLDTVVETTEAIADGDLSRRVPRTGPTEFSRLARSINRMTARILEEQAQRTHLEKVASVGRLAAGVAHEIGNPLGAIGGYAHILRKSSVLDSDALDAVAGIERESARIDRIMRGMLEYARPRRRITSRIDLNVTVNEVVQLLRDQGTLREVAPEVALQNGLPKLIGDGHELEQVLVNLILNAVDAMQGHGKVWIVTQSVAFEDITRPQRPPQQRSRRLRCRARAERARALVDQQRRRAAADPQAHRRRLRARRADHREREDLRSVLHDEGARTRHGARPRRRLAHRRRTRRHDLGAPGARGRRGVHDVLPRAG